MSSVKSFKDKGNPITNYVIEHSERLHPAQKKLMDITMKHCEYYMMGAPEVLQLNQILIRSLNAKKVLDVGVFTGMSSLAAALALPDDGKVVALDVSEEYTKIGQPCWEEAGVRHKIDLRIQPALDSLQELIDGGEEGTFDYAFIDADKQNYLNYYNLCLKLLRPRGIIAVDNVLWSGAVADENDQSESTIAIRKLNDFVAKDDRVNFSMLNIGDGLTLAQKK